MKTKGRVRRLSPITGRPQLRYFHGEPCYAVGCKQWICPPCPTCHRRQAHGNTWVDEHPRKEDDAETH